MRQRAQSGHQNLQRRATLSWPKSLQGGANHLRDSSESRNDRGQDWGGNRLENGEMTAETQVN
jgi:hypothetical protein